MNITNSDMNLISFVIYFLLFEFLLQKKDGLRFVTPKKFVKSIPIWRGFPYGLV